MRSSYDSLFERVKTVLAKDPYSGHLFVFVNSRRTTCKCLYYDGTGLVILSNQLTSYCTSFSNRRLFRYFFATPFGERIPATAVLDREIRPGILK